MYIIDTLVPFAWNREFVKQFSCLVSNDDDHRPLLKTILIRDNHEINLKKKIVHMP